MISSRSFGCLLFCTTVLSVSGCGLIGGDGSQTSLLPSPPVQCDGLREGECLQQSHCAPIYAESGCACAACEPGVVCPPCECPPPTRTFVACEAIDPCEGLDEQACRADATCEPLYLPEPCPAIACDPADPNCGVCDPTVGYGGCRTAPPTCAPVACDLWCEYGFANGPDGCPTCACNPGPCEGLPEDACRAEPGCEPEYRGRPCAGAPCDPNDPACDAALPCDPADPNCGFCDPTVDYAGCRPAPPVCPPVCEIACPYGKVRDANGCEICECLPGPGGCADLSEGQCAEDPRCEPRYVESGCVCPACEPGRECPPCECPPPSREYAGCEDVNTCSHLDERACVDAPDCRPHYGRGPCPDCEPGRECPPCEDGVFLGCEPEVGCPAVLCEAECPGGYAYDAQGCQTCECLPPVCPEVLCDVYCEFGHRLDADGCETCECLPAPRDCEGLSEASCIDAPECEPWYGDEGCACDACVPGEACPPCECPDPERYAGCRPC